MLRTILFSAVLLAPAAAAADEDPTPASPDAPAPTPTPAPYPQNPFAEEYQIPRPTETGISPGQARSVLMIGATVSGQENAGLRIADTTEYIHTTFTGSRYTLGYSAPIEGGIAGVWSFRGGPSLHLRPFRSFDVGAFFEGGIAASRSVKGQHVEWAPILVPGVSCDLFLAPLWYLHVEALWAWARGLEPEDSDYRAIEVVAGLGVTF